jgi:hypothetical protein
MAGCAEEVAGEKEKRSEGVGARAKRRRESKRQWSDDEVEEEDEADRVKRRRGSKKQVCEKKTEEVAVITLPELYKRALDTPDVLMAAIKAVLARDKMRQGELAERVSLSDGVISQLLHGKYMAGNGNPTHHYRVMAGFLLQQEENFVKAVRGVMVSSQTTVNQLAANLQNGNEGKEGQEGEEIKGGKEGEKGQEGKESTKRLEAYLALTMPLADRSPFDRLLVAWLQGQGLAPGSWSKKRKRAVVPEEPKKSVAVEPVRPSPSLFNTITVTL